MGDQRTGAGPGRAGRHRRSRTPLLERREHRRAARRTRALPAPTPSALVGIAVLVLIGAGVIHLSSTGTAVPLGEPTTAVTEEASETSPAQSAPPDRAEPAAGTSEEPDGSSEGGDGPLDDAAAGGSEEGQAELIVHVSGAVAAPGVVRLPPGSRVDDALRAAGGATGQAELESVNLARPLVDGEQVHVPVPGEEPRQVESPPGDAGSGAARDTADAAGAGAGPIDLNTATGAELEELPGVGPAIAQRIIEHREKNGPFRSVDDLIEVSGIGPATLEELRDQVTVSS